MAKPEPNQNTVVVPAGIDPGKSYSCVRSLSRAGLDTIVASEYDDLPAAASRSCDESISIPPISADLEAYKDALVGIAARPDVDTILPIRPQDPYVFAKYRSEFEQYVDLVVPSFDTLRLCHDRLRLAEAAREAGVPTAETRLLGDVDDWDSDLIIKARYNLLADEYLGQDTSVIPGTVKTVEFVRDGTVPDTDAIREAMYHEPVVQEYIHSAGKYVFGALYDHGDALATFQHRQIRGDSYTHGGGVYRKSVDIPELESTGRALLDSLEWHGLACIEYMEDARTGEFKFIEINPRLWQSTNCAIQAGADFPVYYWLQSQGRSDEIDSDYETGVGTHTLYGEMKYFRSLFQEESPFVERPSPPVELLKILASFAETPNFDDFHADDPLPAVVGVKRLVESQLL
ncbi:carboxylate--amine ligase [Halapricum desulfuricans]|uniref:Putative ATP-grasp enzyme n=1 Tax=Halapricum desulfuricans TaxID=2841257 RepID=A0A897NTG4_9EURY|nr:carboxylate--amine ligase [Halapricum desulfuricans]QSG16067.1 putative ATP-grasp enzyme [Halapricum desulfuricans]